MNVIKKYDAYLTFSPLTSIQDECVRKIFADQNLLFTLDSSVLEFEFVGRDKSDIIIQLFQKIAKILLNADGEIRCEIDDDDLIDPEFRFYSIRNGELWEQKGVIMRTELTKMSSLPSA